MNADPASDYSSANCEICVFSVNGPIRDKDYFEALKPPHLITKLSECEVVGSDSNLRELQSELIKILSQKK